MTQTYNNNNESSAEIRADIERTRGRMSENIDKIQHQLSPENLKQQAQETVRSVVQDSTTALTDYVKQNSREIGAGMVDTIKRHPLPAALIGVGIGWLLVENYSSDDTSSSQRYGQQNRYRTYDYQTPSPSDRYWRESGYSYGYGPESNYQSSDRANYSTQYYGGVDVEAAERMGNYASGYYPYEQQGSADYQGNVYQGSAYRTTESYGREEQEGRISQAVDKVKEKASEMSQQIREGAEQVRARAQEAGHQMQDRVRETGQTMQDRARQTGHQVQDQAHYARREAEHQANMARGNAQYYTEQARQQASQMGHQMQEYAQDAQYYAQQAGVQVQRSLHDNPLIFGGIALGVGALLGLALPSTRIENKTMGATSDQMKESAERIGRDVQHRAEHVASEMQPKLEGIAHQVADDVKEAGRTAMDDLKQSGREAAKELQDAASQTQEKAAKEAEGTKETAKNEADKVRSQAQEDARTTTSNA